MVYPGGQRESIFTEGREIGNDQMVLTELRRVTGSVDRGVHPVLVLEPAHDVGSGGNASLPEQHRRKSGA
jgi:hypothetical protein